MRRREYVTVTGATVLGLAGTSTGTATPAQETDSADQFELVDISVPNEVPVMTPFTYSYTIANRGEEDADLWIPYTVDAFGEREDDLLGLTIPAQSEQTIEFNQFTEYLGTISYQLHAFDATLQIESIPATLAFSEEWRSPNHVRLAIDGIEFRDTYEWSAGGTTVEETAPDGAKWAFVSVRAENVARENVRVPAARDIVVTIGNSEFEQDYLLSEDDVYESDTVTPGTTREGTIAYEVPEDAQQDDITVVYRESGYEGVWEARWTAGSNAE